MDDTSSWKEKAQKLRNKVDVLEDEIGELRDEAEESRDEIKHLKEQLYIYEQQASASKDLAVELRSYINSRVDLRYFYEDLEKIINQYLPNS